MKPASSSPVKVFVNIHEARSRQSPEPELFDQRVGQLIREFECRLPDRADQLSPIDLEPYRSVLPQWKRLFACYDLIEAYSTDTILPMLAGVPYVAYEHGTIREIPFQRDSVGRLTALSYALASFTFITNPDCITAADHLGITRRGFVPHLIDEKYYAPSICRSGALPEGVRHPYVFCPSRHDWKEKGTDIVIKSFARLAVEYPQLQLLMTSWGVDVERSRKLAASGGIADRVVFSRPMHIHNLIRVASRACMIVDQFRYGVFGGIGPTALAVGTPLVTHLDYEKYNWCMEKPPYFEASNAESCYRAMAAAMRDNSEEQIRERRQWMRHNYWYGDVVRRHVEVYVNLLDGAPADSRSADALPVHREAFRLEVGLK